ncbi:MAG: hypothetical protein H6577_20440 [Lewinellaceae bacterium]|nr:hypothetical protein [Lewinellaceae bacterium]
MPKGRYISLILIFICPLVLHGSCFGPSFTITELLNYDAENHHIFSGKILKTFIRGINYESIAVVLKVYKGSPRDTVYINSGGGTMAGGEKLMPNSEWLIFSMTEDSMQFGAIACDYLSSQLKDGNNQDCGRRRNTLGEIYIEVLEQYESIRQERFTGHKLIYGRGMLIAEGDFINGLPDGKWTHFSRYDAFEHRIKRSEINYSQGRLEGEYLIYHEDEDENIVIERRIYGSNLPISKEIHGGYEERCEYLSESERKFTTMFSDSLGNVIKQISHIEMDYEDEDYQGISFRDGYYLNKLERDSSKYFPLAEGYYSKGARIGEWKFYNKKGELVRTENYPDSVEESQLFQIYQDDGQVKLAGLLANRKRLGVWKYFFDGKLEYQESYNFKGEKGCRIHNYTSGGMEYTPYQNNKKHGQKIVFNADGTIRSIESYTNGNLNGMSVFFNEDGTIEKELNFINSRAFSVRQDENQTFYHNGFMSGHYVGINGRTNKKSTEGELWNGYRIGVWIDYKEDGSYRKIYYPTDTNQLMNQCGHESPILHEEYDANDNLIRTWKY